MALFCTRTWSRILRLGFPLLIPEEAWDDSEWRRGFDQVCRVIDPWIEKRTESAET
jgi:hypothetical protein